MAALPPRFEPQLATLVKIAPNGDEWLHELKFDGYRIGCRIDGGDIRLLSRNGKDWTDRFGEVRDAAGKLRVRRALLDGEVAVVLPDGRTSFQALQHVFSGTTRDPLVYFVFDLLHLDGENVARLPLEERKARLHRLLPSRAAHGVLRYSEHVTGHGRAFLEEACRLGLEGIVSKRRDLPYRPGRGSGWVKSKCLHRQEFVIGGFTDPEGSRAGIGALLVGVHDRDGRLVYAGKVGTGFSRSVARDLRAHLERLEQPTCPFTPPPPRAIAGRAHWVRPQLVCEVAFAEWTGDGRIRHPSFQGLRSDKRAREVVHERPASIVPTTPTSAARGRGARPAAAPRSSGRSAPPSSAAKGTRARAGAGAAEVAGVRLTHPERVLYPEVGVTKFELARFYEEIADWMLPHLAGRALTLVRCPQGVGDSCFYMKHSHAWASSALRRVRIREKTKIGEYLVADSVAGVVALVQMDVLEIHTWNSRVEDVERPDRLVFDLDPGPEVRWPAVVAAARLVRSALATLGLASFVKTTGGNGLHVVAPLVPDRDWAECFAFSRGVAETIVRQDPRGYTTAMAKAGRERKILIDFFRNNRTNTSVAAFSTRARPKASVSVTLAWEELSARVRSDQFTVRNLGRRLQALSADPWKAYWKTRQRISDRALAAVTSRA